MNLQSPAYMAGTLTTQPPRQLRLRTNPGIYGMQGNATKPDKQVNFNSKDPTRVIKPPKMLSVYTYVHVAHFSLEDNSVLGFVLCCFVSYAVLSV